MFKGRHLDRSVILLRVRWYLAYNLSLRDLEEMMAERGLSVYHSTVHRWVVHFAPQLLERSTGASGVSLASGTWTRRISRFAASGCISIAPSTALATQSNSSSAKAVTFRPPNAFCGKRLRAIADRIASSLTVARPITRRSFPAMSKTACEINRGIPQDQSASARVSTSTIGSSRTISVSSGVFAPCSASSHRQAPTSSFPASRWFT